MRAAFVKYQVAPVSRLRGARRNYVNRSARDREPTRVGKASKHDRLALMHPSDRGDERKKTSRKFLRIAHLPGERIKRDGGREAGA